MHMEKHVSKNIILLKKIKQDEQNQLEIELNELNQNKINIKNKIYKICDLIKNNLRKKRITSVDFYTNLENRKFVVSDMQDFEINLNQFDVRDKEMNSKLGGYEEKLKILEKQIYEKKLIIKELIVKQEKYDYLLTAN